MTRTRVALLLLCLFACRAEPRPTRPSAPAWQDFSQAAFARAKREHKWILLSVQAAFCHWCHVMNATTYRDPRVLALLAEHFVVLRVDEAARPDLHERYARWGWPATALLTSEAQPVLTLRGHQPPAQLAALLERVVRGEAFEVAPAPARGSLALEETRARVSKLLDAHYDASEGGWGTPQKYPFAAPVEHALWRGDATRASKSLLGYRQLIDPVAGGMFQYSLEGVWTRPHYEKLLSIQAGAIATFSAAARAGLGTSFLADAQKNARYLLSTLRTSDGAFMTSQAADVGELGEPGYLPGDAYYGSAIRPQAPALDTHVYADLNGMAITALCELYRADGDEAWLQAARTAMATIQQRLARGAAFLHADDRADVFYLSDQVELARALHALSSASGEPAFERAANATVDWTLAHLQHEGGFASDTGTGVFADRSIPFEHNAKLARLLLTRAHVEDDPRFKELAEGALKALADPRRIESQGRQLGDYALALEQHASSYVMFSVVGEAGDPRARALLDAAWRTYLPRGIVSLRTPAESRYPYPGHAVIYLCSDNACSSPIEHVSALAPALAAFLAEED